MPAAVGPGIQAATTVTMPGRAFDTHEAMRAQARSITPNNGPTQRAYSKDVRYRFRLIPSGYRKQYDWSRAYWRNENGSHRVRNTAFAEDASRNRRNPDICTHLRSSTGNLRRVAGCNNISNSRWRAALELSLVLKISNQY